MARTAVIQAAGGVVFRPHLESWEVLAVHRPRYDDWTLPKGKNDPGETTTQAALREVEEETGLSVQIVGDGEIGCTEYTDNDNRPKQVTYYGMRSLHELAEQSFVPNSEVDQIRWIPLYEAEHRLTYDHDVRLLTGIDFQQLSGYGQVWLVRHAKAGSRHKWDGLDIDRPLTPRGERQAQALVSQFQPKQVGRIFSSPYLRCRQTVEPLAAELGLPIEIVPSLGEGSEVVELSSFIKPLVGLNPLLCSHGDMIPAWLSYNNVRLPVPQSETPATAFVTAKIEKASVWHITFAQHRPVAAEYFHPPELRKKTS